MRIAVFISHPIQYFTPLWKALSQMDGVTVKVFYYSDHAAKKSFDPGFGVSLAWDIDLLEGHDYEFLPRQWPTRSSLEYTWRGLNKNLRCTLKQGWDAVYVADYVHINNWLIACHCRQMGIPVLCHIDSNFLTEKNRSPLRRLAKRLVVGAFFRGIAGGLAVGDHARDYFTHYGMPAERVFLCPYPIDVARFNQAARSASSEQVAELRQKYRLPADKRLVLFTGKFIENKRPYDLLRAMKLLGDDRAVAVFVGDGKLRPMLESEGEGRIIITGFVNQKDIPVLLSLGTMLVLPSSYEPYGLVASEAAAVGIPSIVSDACGCQGPNGVVRDGENGLVYPVGNVRALAEKIKYLLDNPQVRDAFASRCPDVVQFQSPANVAALLVNAARQVIAFRGGPRRPTAAAGNWSQP